MFNIQDELRKLPDKPGIYIMRDEKGEAIYVGKAVNLKNRVKQYFQSLAGQTPKVAAMVPRIKSFEYIVTDNELEALILECNLIKKYKPRFNILLKDDKNYPYIKVTMNEEYPRLVVTRRVEKDGAKYFGPYSSASAVKESVDLIKKLFPIKSCRRILPRDAGKNRPCLNYHIYQCLAPCQGGVNREEYRNLMKDICSFLGGKQEEIIRRLENEMKEAADNMDFEKAALLRDKINSVRQISERQKVLSTTASDQDVVALSKENTDACIQVFFIRGGKLIGRESFMFEGVNELEDGELLASFIKQFYGSAEYVPGEIILQEDFPEIRLVEKWLSDKKSARVHLKVPMRGEKHELVEMVSRNALIALRQFQEKAAAREKLSGEGLKKLACVLGLENPPARIEAYDISNTGSSDMASSMVVFENGLPAKKEYRRFRIKSTDVQNDYACLQETIYRRFTHDRREINQEGRKGRLSDRAFASGLPGLILVDGGLGHVNAALSVLEELGIRIPVYGMVKNEKHRTRGLAGPDGEVELAENLPVLRFVTAIQDEAHRFALEYNRRLRSKRYAVSALDGIEGIGPKRKKALIRHFRSLNKIKEAEVDDLAAVEGVSESMAARIYEHFHRG